MATSNSPSLEPDAQDWYELFTLLIRAGRDAYVFVSPPVSPQTYGPDNAANQSGTDYATELEVNDNFALMPVTPFAGEDATIGYPGDRAIVNKMMDAIAQSKPASDLIPLASQSVVLQSYRKALLNARQIRPDLMIHAGVSLSQTALYEQLRGLMLGEQVGLKV